MAAVAPPATRPAPAAAVGPVPAAAPPAAAPATPGADAYDVEVAVSTAAADLAAQRQRLAALRAQLAVQRDGFARAQAELELASAAAAAALETYSSGVDALFQAQQAEATQRDRLLRAELDLARQRSELGRWVRQAYQDGGGALADSPTLQSVLNGGSADELDTTMVALRRVGRVKSRRAQAYAAAEAERQAASDAAAAAAGQAEQALALSAGAKQDADRALAAQRDAVAGKAQVLGSSTTAATVAQRGVDRAAAAYAQAKAALDAARERAAAAASKTDGAASATTGYAPGLAGPVRDLLAWGQSHVGEPYIFGATGPHAWDCSSFARGAYAQVGIGLPRTAQAQRNWLAGGHGHLVPLGAERPGDLIFIDSYLGRRTVGHVMIVWDPATRTTIEARSTTAGVGHFSYGPAGHTIFEIWRATGLRG